MSDNREAALLALSPLDGRYAATLRETADLFSEFNLFRYRIRIELAWLRHLASLPELHELHRFSPEAEARLRSLVNDFSITEALRIKEIEKETRHDVKAVEYYLAEKFRDMPELAAATPFIHFACTSVDIDNLCQGLLMMEAREKLLLPLIDDLMRQLSTLAKSSAAIPMLSRTHGQAASPTTLGKEIGVFYLRLTRQRQCLVDTRFSGKFNGSVGNFNAHTVAYPELPWAKISRDFVQGLGLTWNPCTTQVEGHDSLAEFFHALIRTNCVLLDFCKDIWGYISLGYFQQQARDNEVGSSVMPHKINPIDFENAEGNLDIACNLLGHLALHLPQSRWQRDLSNSTRWRNIGTAIGHTYLAWHNIGNGTSRLQPNAATMKQDLDEQWSVLAEAVQTVLRRYGDNDAYNKMKDLTRGKPLDKKTLHAFVKKQKLPEAAKEMLLELRPDNYLGNAIKQADNL